MRRHAVRKGVVAVACLALLAADLEQITGWAILGGGVVGEAAARVGRPRTPVSVAGTARRTTARVARRTAVRISVLPAGCVYGPYYGANYWYCGGVYYQQSGDVYIQVVFE